MYTCIISRKEEITSSFSWDRVWDYPACKPKDSHTLKMLIWACWCDNKLELFWLFFVFCKTIFLLTGEGLAVTHIHTHSSEFTNVFSPQPNQINVFLFSPYLTSLITVDHTPAKLPFHKPLSFTSGLLSFCWKISWWPYGVSLCVTVFFFLAVFKILFITTFYHLN